MGKKKKLETTLEEVRLPTSVIEKLQKVADLCHVSLDTVINVVLSMHVVSHQEEKEKK